MHLGIEFFLDAAGIKATHVPYRGSAPAMPDLMSGKVHVMFDNLPSSLPHIRSGKLKALAVTSAVRSVALPDVPTVAEAGGAALKGYEAIRKDGTQKNVLDTMQSRNDLYDYLGYHAYEQKLDKLFAEGKKK